MVLQLHPAFAPAWISPTKLLLGTGPERIVLEDPTETELDLLDELRRGATQAALNRVLGRHGAPPAELASLLSRLTGALGTPEIPLDPGLPQPVPGHIPLQEWEHDRRSLHRRSVLVQAQPTATEGTAEMLREALRTEGFQVSEQNWTGGETPHFVVVVTHALPVPQQWRGWLREGIPHLCVVTAPDGGVKVGSPVLPGQTPCLWCRISSQAERDHDATVALIRHHERPGTRPGAAVERIAAGLCVLRVSAGLCGRRTSGVRVCPDGSITPQRSEQFHPECSCRGIRDDSAAAPGTGTEIAESCPPVPAS